MSTTNYKVSQAQINARHVQAAADELTGTTAQNKAVFDNLPEYIAEVYNTLCDYLEDKVVSEQVCGSGISFGSDGKLFWSFSLQEGDEIMSNTLSPEFGDRMLIRSAPPTRSQMDNVYVIITKGEDSNTFLTGSTYDYGSGYASDYEEKFRIETDNGGTYLNVLDETFFNTYMGGEVTVTLNESFAEMRVPAKCINISEAVLPSGSGGVIVRPTEPVGDTTFLWVDTSTDPPVAKYYDPTDETWKSIYVPPESSDAVIVQDESPTVPGNEHKIWINTSTTPATANYVDNDEWTPFIILTSSRVTVPSDGWTDSTTYTGYKENVITKLNSGGYPIWGITGATDSDLPTDSEVEAYESVPYMIANGSTLTFLTKETISTTFYVIVQMSSDTQEATDSQLATDEEVNSVIDEVFE